jgi:hypothetical protein
MEIACTLTYALEGAIRSSYQVTENSFCWEFQSPVRGND